MQSLDGFLSHIVAVVKVSEFLRDVVLTLFFERVGACTYERNY